MSSLVSEGLDVAMYGMGAVFTFLTMLVFATMAMSWLVQKTAANRPEPGSPRDGQPDARQLAIISAAIHQHRNRAP